MLSLSLPSLIFFIFFSCRQERAGRLFILPARAKPDVTSQKWNWTHSLGRPAHKLCRRFLSEESSLFNPICKFPQGKGKKQIFVPEVDMLFSAQNYHLGARVDLTFAFVLCSVLIASFRGRWLDDTGMCFLTGLKVWLSNFTLFWLAPHSSRASLCF